MFTIPRVLRRTFLRERRLRAAAERCARRVVVDEYAQEFGWEDDGRDAGRIWEAAAEAERREWDWGA